jgi:hypothetical protein
VLHPVSRVRGIEVELENYFEFLADDAIRIVGTRVGIETVIGDYQEGARAVITAPATFGHSA